MNDIEPVGRNITQLSETVKSEPWRLIWPSTKKYPEKSPTPGEATITVNFSDSSSQGFPPESATVAGSIAVAQKVLRLGEH